MNYCVTTSLIDKMLYLFSFLAFQFCIGNVSARFSIKADWLAALAKDKYGH